MNRCHICGKRWIRESDSECPRCKPLREMFGDKFGVVADWVREIAEDVSKDAIMGHLNDEDHSS